ncbi:MAG TPA: SapC family protein [Devosia sp.]|nr:SapC family protein [Devosia sp.]
MERPGEPFGFARTTQFIPAVIDEFASACRELTIVFVPGPDRPSPVFLVGFTGGRNLMISDAGEWSGTYVPAFLRRYPFS